MTTETTAEQRIRTALIGILFSDGKEPPRSADFAGTRLCLADGQAACEMLDEMMEAIMRERPNRKCPS